MKIKDIYKEASLSMKGKFWHSFGVILLYLLFVLFCSMILGIIADATNETLGNILSIAFDIIAVPIAFGLINHIYKICHEQDTKFMEFINLGCQKFKQVWAIIGRKILKMIIPFIICIIAIIAAAYSLVPAIGPILKTTTASVYPGITAQVTVTPETLFESGEITEEILITAFKNCAAFAIIAIAAGIWAYIISFRFVIAEYILCDDDKLTGKEYVEKSESMMNGYKGKYFLMLLSVIAIEFIVCFIIGFLVALLQSNAIIFILILALLVGIFYLSVFVYYLRMAFYDLLKDELSLNNSEAIPQEQPTVAESETEAEMNSEN